MRKLESLVSLKDESYLNRGCTDDAVPFQRCYVIGLLCSSSQISNGHVLVVIHICTASQTIKVSIDDTPAQVQIKYSRFICFVRSHISCFVPNAGFVQLLIQNGK